MNTINYAYCSNSRPLDEDLHDEYSAALELERKIAAALAALGPNPDDEDVALVFAQYTPPTAAELHEWRTEPGAALDDDDGPFSVANQNADAREFWEAAELDARGMCKMDRANLFDYVAAEIAALYPRATVARPH